MVNCFTPLISFLLGCLLRLTVFSAAVLYPAISQAADISLGLRVQARDDLVTVEVHNTGADPARNVSVEVELAGAKVSAALTPLLGPNEKSKMNLRVQLPTEVGTYPLFTRVRYRNDNTMLEVLDVGYFNHRGSRRLNVVCDEQTIRVGKTAEVELAHSKQYAFRFFLPSEIVVQSEKAAPGGTRFSLHNTAAQFTSNYAVFSVSEGILSDGVHATAICPMRLQTSSRERVQSRIPSLFLAMLIPLGLLFAGVFARKAKSAKRIAFVRYCFSLSIVSTLFLFYQQAYHIADFLLPSVQLWGLSNPVLAYGKRVAVVLLETLYFDEMRYAYFFRYLADWLFLYMLLLNFFTLYYFIRPQVEQDKYWHLLRSFLSLPGLRRFASLEADASVWHWSRESKVALLAIAVKAFYLPLLVSWAVNQYIHVGNVAQGELASLIGFNQLLVELCIFLDVGIFAFGYLTELPQLKNRIRSVEPTLLGWIVCLACYPPFNEFSFAWADVPLNADWGESSELSKAIALCLISLLWMVYTWASVALGSRASNLTNRGIVSWGPYAYVRHPAYVAKLSVWILTSFFLGTMHFFLVLALVLVYALRAWTEERHLSADPEYLAYREAVPWKCIYKVW